MKKHTILFLAANPRDTDRLALDREARAIQVELERAGYRDYFELVTRWAVEPLDLLRELRKLKPTVVHVSGQGVPHADRNHRARHAPSYGADLALACLNSESRDGLVFPGPEGGAQLVSAAALDEAFAAAGDSVKLVVLSACYSEPHASALLSHVDCVVGTDGALRDDAARSFAIGFYGGLGEREPIATAFRQGLAAISLEGMHTGARPQLKLRAGVDASQLVLAADTSAAPLPSSPETLIDFTTERQRHVRFVGRDDALARIDELLAPGDAGWVVVTGGPGIGKSALLSAWLARRQAAGAVVPHHFVRRQVADWDHPEVIAGSLAAQIEVAFPALRDPAAKPERRLFDLLGRVSKQIGADRHLVVLVDGLDEIRADVGDNPLPRCLPHVVPAGIHFLCAMRPTYPHLGWIEARTPVRRLDLDNPRWAAANEAVVRGFWLAVAPEYQPPLPAATVTTAIDRADGNILHAVMLHDALRDLSTPERIADRIPRGIQGLLGELWDRAALHAGTRVGLGLLCAARQALSLDILAELAGWDYEAKQRFVRDARQLLLEESAAWAGSAAYRPRHDWVRELIAERLGDATLRGHHQTLAHQLATWPPPADPPRREYAVRHALTHRIAVSDWPSVHKLAADLGYLEARARAADVFVIEQALRDTGARCPDPVIAHDLVDLAWALARESHWIRNDSKETASLIWNRLRRAGWTAQELRARITVPNGSAFLRARHVASRESSPLERTLEGHSGWVNACAVTPDGRRVVSASDDHTLKIWDLNTGRTLTTLEGHSARVAACVVTLDGRRVVSASDDHTLKIWDLESGHVLATLEGHNFAVTACAVTPDGRRVISASTDRTLKIWDLESGHVLATLEGHDFAVTTCAVTPDGQRVVSASRDRTLKIWDLASGHALATLEGHDFGVTACAVTPDGRRIISASTDRSPKVWDLSSGHVLTTLEGHTHGVTACVVMPDGRHMVSASHDRTLKVWDLVSGHVLATLEGHSDGVTACAVTPDGRRVVSASDDRTLKIWDLDANRTLPTLDSHAACINACAMTPNGQRMISASHDRTLKIWDVDTGCVVNTLQGHSDWVTACAVAHDGQSVVSASADRTLKVWNLVTGLPYGIPGRQTPRDATIPPGLAKGRIIYEQAIATTRVLSSNATHIHAALDELAASVRVCAVTTDGQYVVSVANDGALKIWDFHGHVVAILTKHGHAVTACAVTPDGQHIVSASREGTLTIWDLATARAITTLVDHADGVRACAVTPDGKFVVSASNDGTLKIWDLTAGRVLATLNGHAGAVTGCAVTPDGQSIISASSDASLKVWDLASARCLLTHRGDAAFQCVAATADVIVAGDRAGTVWFLEWPQQPLLPGSTSAPGSKHVRRPRVPAPA